LYQRVPLVSSSWVFSVDKGIVVSSLPTRTFNDVPLVLIVRS
jgi:hypothetical protein